MRHWINLFESNDLQQEINAWQPPYGLDRPRPEDWEMFRNVRHTCRANVGGGGLCHEVSEWIEHKYGWERQAGTYLSPNGEVAIANHYWNVLPDGSILDCTADQTGEGHDMRLIPLNDPEHGRYDEEWHEDWHPAHEDYEGKVITTGMRKPEQFNGNADFDEQDRLTAERGSHWWATDPEQFQQYIEQQIAYARAGTQNDWTPNDIERWEVWLADVKKRHSGGE